MKNGWVKIFHGEYLPGADEDNVSWSNTRLDGLRGVQITHNNKMYDLVRGLGEYHYSEDYEVQVGTNDHKLLAKRMQFKDSKGWETVEIDTTTNEVRHYWSDNKI